MPTLSSWQYLEGLIERRPDATLAELRTDLCGGMGIDLDESTIRRILLRRGFTRKQVRDLAEIVVQRSALITTTGVPNRSGTQRG